MFYDMPQCILKEHTLSYASLYSVWSPMARAQSHVHAWFMRNEHRL